MKRIIPNITVDNCKEALEYYRAAFGGEVKNVQMADGKEMFTGHEGKVIHSELIINEDCILYLQDFLGAKSEDRNISLMLQMESHEEINKLFSILKEKGTVTYQLQKTFWGSYHAVITDCYGITWSLDYSGN